VEERGLLGKLDQVSLTPSQFTEFAFYMPTGPASTFEPFSFVGREHMRRCYDTPAKMILLFCARQVEKCVAGCKSNKVGYSDGMPVPILDVVVGDELSSYDEASGKVCTGVVVAKESVGEKPCVRVTTRQGHEVRVADTHPFLTPQGWLEVRDLEVGDRLALARQAGVFYGDVDDGAQWPALCAYFISDGGLSGSSITFTKAPGKVLDDFFLQLSGEYAASWKTYPKEGTSSLQHKLSRCPGIHKKLKEVGLLGKLSTQKFVPKEVFRYSREHTALFLNRLWACDGHVKQNSRSKYSIEYASTSLQLVRQVQALLRKFRIPTSFRSYQPEVYKGTDKYSYIIRVETKKGVYRFLVSVGALGKSEGVPIPDPGIPERNNCDTVPAVLLRGLVEDALPPGVSLRKAGLVRFPKAGVTQDRLYTIIDKLKKVGSTREQLDRLYHHIDADVYWDEVEHIEPLGAEECFDIQVEDKSTFLLNGLVTHNSTLLGNRALCYMCMVPSFRVLYVAPSGIQTATFSKDRITEPIETSPVLAKFTSRMLTKNVLSKQLLNRSQITMRYAFLNADRARGIPAYALLLDEFQDFLADNVPVLEQCLSHAPEEWRTRIYAGTPKSLDNNLEVYRDRHSTQGEWMVPCDRCGSAATSRYWNILGEKNISDAGLCCERCGKLIDAQHPDAQWAFMVQDAPFESYRIPQLMVPWVPWDEILLNYRRYSRAKFYNEVLGISYDSGLRPLTTAQVRACCNEDVHMADAEQYIALANSQPVFMGVDWGCHDEDTRILTRKGFKYFRDLTDEDHVASWDPDTRRMLFGPPLVRTVKDWDQPLLHFKTKGGIDLMVTHTHRMRVGQPQGERWVTESAGETAMRGGNVKFVGHIDWEGDGLSEFTLPGLPSSPGYKGCAPVTYRMEDWLELLGYLLSEGGVCLKRNSKGERVPYCLKMSQRETVNPLAYQKIQDCLDRMRIPHTPFPNPRTGDVNWAIYGKQYWHWFSDNVGSTGDTKRIPRELFRAAGKRGLRVLFDAMVLGDGYVDPREGCTGGAYYSTSKGLCEDFQEICIRLGLRCIVRLHKPAEGNRKTRWRAIWSSGRDYQLNTPSRRVKRVPYNGKVYCCKVPSGYIVTERNGCISYQGNTGENSYTVVVLATYIDMRFRVFYAHRFEGEETSPPVQLEELCRLIDTYRVTLVGTDYGGGFDRNDHLIRRYGPSRIFKYQYAPRPRGKVVWNGELGRWICHRTEVMSDIFNAIKKGFCEFPRWEDFQDPFGQDMLNIFSEYNKVIRMMVYKNNASFPDDTFHAFLYCWLVSMLQIKRPDIVTPRQETKHGGDDYQLYDQY